MADIFVDKILHNSEIEKKWFQWTKDLIKTNGFKPTMDKFLEAFAEVSENYWNKNSLPKSWFKGDLKIMEIADQFGIKPIGKKLRLCPFHQDHNKSLSLSNELGVYNCFGCGAKGNIITFYAELKRLKNGN